MKKIIFSTVAIIMMAGAVAFGTNATGKTKAACSCVKCTCPNTTGCTCSK